MTGSPTPLGHELAHTSVVHETPAQVVRLEAAMGLPGLPELLLIFGAIVLLFGAKKLPGLGGAIGESIKNFKKGINKDEEDQKSVTSGESSKPIGDQPSDRKPS
jgi:sec-independent protein translocase protein TatA